MKNFRRIIALSWIITLALFVFICLPWRFPDYSEAGFGKNKLLVKYESVGCSSFRVKVLKGSEELGVMLKDKYLNMGFDEIVFADDSDEPANHMDSAEFYTAGLASRYTYVVYGEVINIGPGARDCCEDKPASYENVPVFKVTKWAPTSYISGLNEPFIDSTMFVKWFAFLGIFLFSSITSIIYIALIIKNRGS